MPVTKNSPISAGMPEPQLNHLETEFVRKEIREFRNELSVKLYEINDIIGKYTREGHTHVYVHDDLENRIFEVLGLENRYEAAKSQRGPFIEAALERLSSKTLAMFEEKPMVCEKKSLWKRIKSYLFSPI